MRRATQAMPARGRHIRSTIFRVEIHRSARKHGIDGQDIEYVVANALATLDEVNDEGINQVLYLSWIAPEPRYWK